MATILDACGFETGDTLRFATSAGTFSVQSSVKRSGNYALRCNPTTTGAGHVGLGFYGSFGLLAALNHSTLYVDFHFLAATLPASGAEPIFEVRAALASKFELRLRSTGALALYTAGGVQIGSDSSKILSANRWYRIGVLVPTGTSATCVVLIDGDEQIRGVGNATNYVTNQLRYGKTANRSGQTVDFYYDDIVVASDLWAGESRVLLLPAAGDGAYTAWTGTYADVDDWLAGVHDGDTTRISSTAVSKESVTVSSIPAGGWNRPVAAVLGEAVVRHSGADGFFKVFLRSGTAEATYSAAAAAGSAYRLIGYIANTDPNTSAAWTNTAALACEVGVENTDGIGTYYCTAMGTEIVFGAAPMQASLIEDVRSAGVRRVAISWQADGNGNAEIILGEAGRAVLSGTLDRMITYPDPSAPPAGQYDVQLLAEDAGRYDLLNGAGAARSANALETVWLQSSTAAAAMLTDTASRRTRLMIRGAGANAAGVVVFYLLDEVQRGRSR